MILFGVLEFAQSSKNTTRWLNYLMAIKTREMENMKIYYENAIEYVVLFSEDGGQSELKIWEIDFVPFENTHTEQ